MFIESFQWILDAVVAPAAEAPALPQVSYEQTFWKMLLSLGALLAVVFVLYYLIRRMGHMRLFAKDSGNIRVLERKSLSPKTAIYRLECSGKEVFITESQWEVKVVSREFQKSGE